MRVPFGLRSYATDSESGSWSGSDVSEFPADSEADSFSHEFRCEADLAEFETFSPKTDSGKSSSPNAPSTELPHREAKKSWSEIDEQARVQEKKNIEAKNMHLSTTAVPPLSGPATTSRSQPNSRRHNSGHSRRGSIATSRSDRSDSWRSGRGSHREKKDKRSSDRRWRNSDQPLKGAVERPYTLPSGPITILKRPDNAAIPKTESESAVNKVPIIAPADEFHSMRLEESTNRRKAVRDDNSSAVGGNRTTAKARTVTTKFGEGFVVENPPHEKVGNPGAGGNTDHLLINHQAKVAKNAAFMAMADLKVSHSKDHASTRSPSGAESYDRTLGGQFSNPKGRRHGGGGHNVKNKDKSYNHHGHAGGGGLYSDRMTTSNGRSNRPNVYIGRRPKLETRHVRDDDFLVGE